MTRYIAASGAALLVFVVLDLLWLGVVAVGFYQRELAALLRPDPVWSVAAVFYVMYLAGVMVFAVAPALDAGAWTAALWRGAVFGLIAYATYDLTNLATLRDFPARLAVVDMAWGTVLTATVSVAAYFAGSRFS